MAGFAQDFPQSPSVELPNWRHQILHGKERRMLGASQNVRILNQ
jgi:hypothetical protein